MPEYHGLLFKSWILNHGSWIMDLGLWILDLEQIPISKIQNKNIKFSDH